jgi:hypothetical protein
MFTRLLALVSLLLLTQTSRSQQSQTTTGDVPETCPVTKASDQPFIPPWPYPKAPYPGGYWFGTDKLWTAPPIDGTWRGLGHYTPTDPTFRQKLFWWRQGYDWRTEAQPKLRVTGRRLDSPAPPLAADRANNGWQRRDQPFMVVGINLPTLGCWEIAGHYENDELTFVVWVAELTEGQREGQRKDLFSRAEGGDVGAEYWLGAGYEQGWFGRADFPAALKWFRRAAAHGNPDAQNSLGQMYENGEGVQRDYVLAADWYRKAAGNVPDRGGAGQGRNNLGLLYMEGLGVPKDYVQAYMWFSLSNSEANLSDAKAQMTPAQIREAERMATEWKNHHSER